MSFRGGVGRRKAGSAGGRNRGSSVSGQPGIFAQRAGRSAGRFSRQRPSDPRVCCGIAVVRGLPTAVMAPPAGNAGFSRHRGPPGRARYVATPGVLARAAEPSRRMRSVSPPACGGLCRLKPAFQNGPRHPGPERPGRRADDAPAPTTPRPASLLWNCRRARFANGRDGAAGRERRLQPAPRPAGPRAVRRYPGCVGAGLANSRDGAAGRERRLQPALRPGGPRAVRRYSGCVGARRRAIPAHEVRVAARSRRAVPAEAGVPKRSPPPWA